MAFQTWNETCEMKSEYFDRNLSRTDRDLK
jgi:hypothetical protein